MSENRENLRKVAVGVACLSGTILKSISRKAVFVASYSDSAKNNEVSTKAQKNRINFSKSIKMGKKKIILSIWMFCSSIMVFGQNFVLLGIFESVIGQLLAFLFIGGCFYGFVRILSFFGKNRSGTGTLTWKFDNETLIISCNGKTPNYYDDNDLPWFSHSKSIATIIVEDGVTSIGRGVFCGCDNLISITVPNSVTDIGEYTFSKCTKLKHIYLQSENPPIIRFYTFEDIDKNTCILHVPLGSKNRYANANHWKKFKNIQEDSE